MEKGSTMFYHGHIISNINKLDLRKDNYIGHRLNFLKNYCQPIQRKIDHIKEDIKFYQNMRDTQYQVIEQEPQITALKAQIANYQQTKDYFESKLDEYDKLVFQIEDSNLEQCKIISQKQQEYKLMNGRTLSTKSYNNKVKGLKREKSLLSSTIGLEENQQYRTKVTEGQELNTSKNIKFPKISTKRPISKYYVFNQSKIINQHNKNIKHRKDLIARNSITEADLFKNPEEQIMSYQIGNQELKTLINQFDRTESLFRECFERKKISIQKSVSQLQSRLITNKDIFLKACQVIGEKQGSISLDQFLELSSDELITLFISFSWLNRKIYTDLIKKRKDIVSVLKKFKNSSISELTGVIINQ